MWFLTAPFFPGCISCQRWASVWPLWWWHAVSQGARSSEAHCDLLQTQGWYRPVWPRHPRRGSCSQRQQWGAGRQVMKYIGLCDSVTVTQLTFWIGFTLKSTNDWLCSQIFNGDCNSLVFNPTFRLILSYGQKTLIDLYSTTWPKVQDSIMFKPRKGHYPEWIEP